jgi:ribosome-associated protein
MAGKSAIADFMVIATGRSQRHVASMAEHLRERVKAYSGHAVPVEGLTQADWVLVDAGDVVVHLFRPEVRAFYNLEKMWSQALPESDDGKSGSRKSRRGETRRNRP